MTGGVKRVLGAVQRVTGSLKRKQKWPGTSLIKLAGAFEGPPDLSERHGLYLTGKHNECR